MNENISNLFKVYHIAPLCCFKAFPIRAPPFKYKATRNPLQSLEVMIKKNEKCLTLVSFLLSVFVLESSERLHKNVIRINS